MNVHLEQGESLHSKDAPPIGRTEAELTRTYGDHTLAFFGLAPENEHFLAPEGRGLVNYRLVNNVAVVSGDPLCAPEEVEQVTRSFLRYCASHRWSVAFYQASPDNLAIYRALKMRPMKMGEEAILAPQTFTLQGAALANVRTSCRRAEREGIRIEWYEGVPPAAVMQQLEGVSSAWLESKAGKQTEESGFSTGRLGEVEISALRADQVAEMTMPSHPALHAPQLVTGVALTSSSEACAFVTFTPIYGTEAGDVPIHRGWGWALDLMRRVPDAPPGAMDLLLVRAVERFRLAGAHRISLGLVALADTRQEMASVARRPVSFMANHSGLFEQRQSLFDFKQKFHPCWESRYLVANRTLALPKIALAVLRLRNYTGKGVVGVIAQCLRYCLVGGANTIIDMSILNALLWRFPTHNVQYLVVYNSLAYASGAVSSFFLNKYWTFRRKQRPTRREVGRFAISLLLEVIYSSILVWLAGKVLQPLITNIILWGNASKLIAVVVGTIISYSLMRFWTFADSK